MGAVPMAYGDGSPAWPLDDPARRVSGDFLAPRVGSSESPRPGAPRYHVAEDLPAPRGTVLLAPEAGTVVLLSDRFYKGSGVMMLQLDSGLVVALGEIEPGSAAEFHVQQMSRVSKGQPLARVGRHRMVHFETYRQGTRRTSRWWVGDPPPASLLDPTDYLMLAAGSPRIITVPATPADDAEPLTPPPASSGGGTLLLLAVLGALVAAEASA